MKYKLVVLGLPRTGTTSIWKTLGDHPEISKSSVKEPYLNLWFEDKVICDIEYMKYYDANKSVLLDGTPTIYKKNYLQFLHSIQMFDVVCIFVKRDRRESISSKMEHDLLWWYSETSSKKPRWIDDDHNIDTLKLKSDIKYYYDRSSPDLDQIFGKGHHITINIENLNRDQNRIYDFLEIERANLNFKMVKNRCEIKNPNIEKLKAVIEVRKCLGEFVAHE